MLDTVVYSYKAGQFWIGCFPRGIDHSLPEDISKRSLYIYYTGNHFNVVTRGYYPGSDDNDVISAISECIMVVWD